MDDETVNKVNAEEGRGEDDEDADTALRNGELDGLRHHDDEQMLSGPLHHTSEPSDERNSDISVIERENNDRDSDNSEAEAGSDDGDETNPILAMRKLKMRRKEKKLKTRSSDEHRASKASIRDDAGDDAMADGEENRPIKKKNIKLKQFTLDEAEEASDDEEDGEVEDDVESSKKKKRKQTISSDEDSSEEDSDEEMTEADKQFIVEDEEVEEGEGDGAEESEKERRRRKKRKQREEEENLDDDDLELIDENTGRKKDKFKRLRKKGDEPRSQTDLAAIFDEEDEGLSNVVGETTSRERADELELSDDEMDFIVDDEEDGNEAIDEAARAEQRRKKRMEAKNIGQYYGITDEVWHDIQDLFGDGSDYAYALDLPEDRGAVHYSDEEADISLRQKPQAKITDIYEPSEIAARMLTEEDEAIQIKNMPERFQMRGEYPTPTEEEYINEARFILKALKEKSKKTIYEVDATEKAIVEVLKFFHEKFFEVPFIMAHRRDYFDTLLERSDLWRIYDLDVQYHTLEQKRKAVRTLLSEVRAASAAANADTYPDEMLEIARSFEDVQDVLQYLQLHYRYELQRAEEGKTGKLKRAYRKSQYEESRAAGLEDFVKLFGVDIRSFSESITTHKTSKVPQDINELPLDAAARFVVDKAPFNTPERVLEAGRQMLAQAVSADPIFRQFVRKVYETDAIVTVTPTEKGKREIQPLHPLYPIKYLTEKPIFKFNDAQFLQILAAEEQGLFEVSIRVDEEIRLLEDVQKHIANDFVNEFAEKWNEERRRVANIATKTILFPQIVKWLKELKAQEASDWLAEQCRIALEQKIDVAPFRRTRTNNEEDEEESDHPRVMALSWGEGDRNSATIVICLDEQGLVASTLKLSRMQSRDLKQKDHDELSVAIKDFRPDVIVVGGLSIATKTRLMPDLAELIERLTDDPNNNERSFRNRRKGPFVKPELIMVDDEIARLAMTSQRFAKEFPEPFSPLARYCISLARRVQDPTMECATLFNSDDEIRLLRIHPLQNYLREDKLKFAFERAFINVVNFTGVDINEAANPILSHRSHTLQFVSGLGPRKAQFMISKIAKTGGKLESRSALITKKLVTSAVFMNCASFIRIRVKHFQRDDTVHDVLDDTRIHPEDYDLARKMAADALDIEDVVEGEDQSQHVAELMEDDPQRLNLLMLDDYAEELYKRMHEPKKLTLNDIKAEIIQPYRDRRRRFASATNGEVFTMLTNETMTDTLRPTIVVSCRVTKIFDRFIKVQLNSGLEGNINQAKMPASLSISMVHEGQYLEAAVEKVDPAKFTVELDAREEVTGKNWMRNVARSTLDPHFRTDREIDDEEKKPLIPKVPKLKQARVVNHPYWKNVSYQEAVDILSPSTVRRGTVIIRPSTKGNDHLSITWKVDEGVFQHVDIKESRKDNDWSVGKVLTVEGKNYDDLDEIIATYIDPIAVFFGDAVGNAKFKRYNLNEMFHWASQQAASSRRSSYGVIMAPEKPGRLFLVYQHPHNRPKHEYINVTPEGFIFRGRKFRRLDQLFDGFKAMEAQKAKDAMRQHAGPSASSRSSSDRPHHQQAHRPSGSSSSQPPGQSGRWPQQAPGRMTAPAW